MPEESGTDWSTPIPLRDNGSGDRPSIWARLRAADRVQSRLHLLAEVLTQRAESPDRNALAAVMQTLARDAAIAVWGSAEDVLTCSEGAPAALWIETVEVLLFPGPARPAAATDRRGPSAAAAPEPPTDR